MKKTIATAEKGAMALSIAKKIQKRFESGKMMFNFHPGAQISTDEASLEHYIEACQMVSKSDLRSEYIKCYPRFSEKIKQAIYLASEHHTRHLGKKNGALMMGHLLRLNRMLTYYDQENSLGEELNLGAILHRMGECKSYSLGSCKGYFGSTVAQIVFESPEMIFFETSPQGEVTIEKLSWREEVVTFLSQAAQGHHLWLAIFCATQIDRLCTLMRVYRAQGEAIWEAAGTNKEDLMWLVEQALHVFTEENITEPVVKRILDALAETLEEANQLFENNAIAS